MPTDFFSMFTSLGLSPTEAKVYLSNLELGPTSVQDIAKKADISRTAAYDVISALQGYGLVSTFKQGKKTLFAAEDPERAVAYFRSSVRKFRTKLEDFERTMPELKMMIGGERPVVRFFEGKEALPALFYDLASTKAERFDEVSNYDDIYEYLDPEHLKDVQHILDSLSVHTRILHRGDTKRMKPGVEYCKLMPELGDFHGDIWIYSNRVAFVSFRGKLVSVIIESEAFADTARVLFEAAWKICSYKRSPG